MTAVSAKYSSYPAYRPSGVEWLGDVPEHWEAKRLRHVLTRRMQYGANEPAEFENPEWPRYVRITDVDEGGRLRNETFRSLPPDCAAPYLLEDGDILFARSGATVGKTFLYRPDWGDCCFAGYLIQGRPKPTLVLSDFLYAVTRSNCYESWKNSIFVQATIQNISAEKYADFSLPIPPLPEQRAIADFLDRETGRIDALIAKKRRLIELLEEKRSALISHAVTKGLNPDAPVRPSGIEWLGDIPAHWSVKELGFVSRIGNGCTPGRENTAYWFDGDYPWLNSSVVNHNPVEDATQFVTPRALRECHLPIVRPKSVLVGITGQGKTRGMSTVLTYAATINQHLAYITPHERAATADFLCWELTAAYEVLREISDGAGSTKGALTCEQMGQFRIAMPPLAEQNCTSAHLTRETGRIGSLVAKNREVIDKLQEYRTALISAAVTGKIDVRGET